jgi:hypothetical protein
MSAALKIEGPASAATDPDHGHQIPLEGKAMNTDASITMPDRSSTAPVAVLIAAHIASVAEHDCVFNLSDWGLADGSSANAKVDAVDDALLAICSARPSSQDEADLRRRYLVSKLPSALAGSDDLLKAAIAALIDAGGAA